ncbi:hypothetical protein EER27_06570 [Lysobacter psychrotolerans]|uniref:Uncharacterized protein n=2 Tax=Montanilutibacter psychrotolerans TaxID=1327343 RepID=A0A3M8T167_9GAMM|nr:hypothetical protein EER27_06570 [Lysobacter psychrotolerans]
MIRIVLSVWIYISSLVAIGTTAGLISRVLAVYPQAHLASFGPVVPTIATTHAAWLGSAPAALGLAAAISIAAGLYFWRSRRARESKTFAVTMIAAVNYFLAFFCVMTLLVAYFYLPKIANMA